MANREKWAKCESPTPVEEVDDAATEEKEDQKYPVMKLTNIGDDALEIVNRLAGVTIVSLSSEEDEEPKSPWHLHTGKSLSPRPAPRDLGENEGMKEFMAKRKAATKVNKVL